MSVKTGGNEHFGNNKDENFQPGCFEKWFNFITCRCDVNEEQFTIAPVGFTELFRFGSRTDKLFALIAIICGILAGMAYTFPYYISGKLATVIIQHGPGDSKLLTKGYPYVALDLIFALGVLILTIFQNFLLKKACNNITTNLRIEFIKALLRQDATWLDKQKFGALNAQLTENIDTIKDGIGEKVGMVIRGFSAVVGCCIFGILVNWKTFLVIVGSVPICVLLMSFMGRLVNITSKKQLPFSEKAAGILQESLINVKTVQCCNGEREMIDRYCKTLKDGRGYGVLSFFWNGFFDGTTFFILYVFFSITFYYGSVQAFRGEIEAGDVFILPNVFFGAAYYLAIVSPHFVSILKARIACALIYAKIDRVPDVQDEGIYPSLSGGKIKFNNVYFGYSPERKVLHGLTFEAEPGSTTALVGHSGNGKTTCISLITRLYKCSSGSVTIDGVDVKDMNIKALRKLIGIVQQEPVLFSGSIKENIRLGDESIDDAAVERACRIANAHDFIKLLSDGYDTQIGQGSVQLSGGQKQRIAIARAIVNDPKILLLDEATSALDVDSEFHVQHALRAAATGRTTIVIAHRLSTLRDAKKIVVINEGRVLEEGTHQELKEKEGLYAQLVKAQEFKEKQNRECSELENEILRRHSTLGESQLLASQGSGRLPVPKLSIGISTSLEIKNKSKKSRLSENGLFLLYKNTQGNRGKLITATILSIFRGFELPLFVLALNFIFLYLGKNDDWISYRNRLLKFVAINIALGIFSFFTIFLPTALYGWASENIVDAIKVRSFATFLRRDAKYFDQPETSNAKLISRINSDSPQLKSALDNRMVHFVNNVTAILTLVVQAFVFSWQITLAGTALVIVMTSMILYFAHLAQIRNARFSGSHETANLSVEIIENIRTIQLLTQEDYFVEKYIKSINKTKKDIVDAAFFESIVLAIGMASAYLCDLVSYGTGLPLIYHGQTSSNGCFVAAMNICMTSWAIQFSSMSAIEIMHAKPAAESLIPLIDSDIDNNGHLIHQDRKNDDKSIKGMIEARQVHFAYPARPNVKVANGLNLRIEPGKTMALVGPSGGGKSTIIQLLERLYVQQSGKILIDGEDIDSFNLHNLRNQMALVGQEPVLFSGSIIENIKLGTTATFNEIKEACKTANASGFIESLPLGYETEVGEKGAQLSGGQKQRIAIARAIVRKPKILLLDEATSALDTESERSVQEALERASESRTCITIAHRLSSIQHSDRIYYIEAGRVVESGTHDELIEADGKYADLVRKQELNQ